MSDSGIRRGLLAASLLTFGLLVLLGFVFWRTMPPVGPASAIAASRTERPFPGVPPLPSVIAHPRLDGIRAAILDEPENVRISGPGEYAQAIAFWRRWLGEAGATIVAPQRADVLILPQALCLGPVHRRLVAAHLARGGGIVTTGAVGAYDGLCTPLRDTLVAELLGIQDSDIRAAPRRKNDAHYAVLLGETVLGAGLPPGARVEFSPNGEIVFRSPSREMLYADYSRKPMNAGAPYFDAAAMRSLVGRGRVAAFGFSPMDLVGDWSVDVGSMVVANAVRWAAGHDVYQLAPWPAGKRAAAVMAFDVEADYQNARHALDALEPYKLPGTAFVVGKLAEADQATTQRLFATMEIGTHTHNHYPLDTLSAAAQMRELAQSKRVVERLLGKPVPGMRPPEERYTLSTLQDWADLGGRYVFANNNARVAAPEIIPLLPDSLVLLNRVSDDDFEILERDKVRDRSRMARTMVTQVDEIVAYRGLYMFSYHSHMFSQKELVPVLRALAEKLRDSPQVWTATAGEVATWWRGRAAVGLTTDPTGRSVTLANRGPTPFEHGVVLIDTPEGLRRWVRLPTIQPGASVRVDGEGRVAQGVASR
jgi:peptidoglycan/xylan/chitin deacetylase (PgdA/CDA1 family)